jgi:hypothetical protein
MTPPVPEKVRVLSPAWYRAAVEFQGRPEQERLAFLLVVLLSWRV